MMQTIITYLAVAAAAVWVAWSMLLPKSLKRRLKAKRSVPAGKADCGDDCGCGD